MSVGYSGGSLNLNIKRMVINVSQYILQQIKLNFSSLMNKNKTKRRIYMKQMALPAFPSKIKNK